MKMKILVGILIMFVLLVPTILAWNIEGEDYDCRQQILSNATTSNLVVNINDTSPPNYWFPVQSAAIYYNTTNCTGSNTVGTLGSTPSAIVFENGTSRTGNNATDVYNADVIGKWHHDNNTGTVTFDSTSNNRNGTMSGVTWNTTDCIFGNCLFNNGGDNQEVLFIDHEDFDCVSNCTWESWAKFNNIAQVDNQFIISKTGFASFNDITWSMRMPNNKDIITCQAKNRWVDSTFGIDGSTNLTQNTWYHIICTFSDGVWKMYLNGIEEGTLFGNTSTTLDTSTVPLRIMGEERTSESFFGNIDETSIYSRIIGQTEAQERYWNGINNLTSLGPNTLEFPPIDITITAPTAITFWTATDFLFNFSAISDMNTTFEMNATLDGVLIFNNTTYVNGSDVILFQNVSGGSHNFTVIAQDEEGTTQKSVIFTINNTKIEEVIFNTPVFETSTQAFNITIRINPDLIQSITSTLFYNSTNIGTTTSTNNGTHILGQRLFTIPLIRTNNTNLSFVFENNITFFNGTSILENSTEENQTVVFSYFPINFFPDKLIYIETENITVTINVSNFTGVADLEVFVDFNATGNETSTNISGPNPALFRNIFSAPEQNATAEANYTMKPYVRVQFNGTEFNRSLAQIEIRVFQLSITDCSTGVPMLRFNMFEETNETAENGSLEIAIFAIGAATSRNFSFDFTSNHTHTICIDPPWASFNVNATIQYSGVVNETIDYPIRFYFLNQAPVSNITSEIFLFMLNDVIGTLISPITVKNSIGTVLQDVVIQFQRYYIGQNKYETVAMALTDINGIGGSFLQTDVVFYRIVLLRYGRVLRTISQSLLTETNPVYATSPVTITTNIDIQTGIEFGCTTTDEFISCTVIDATGIMSEACLNVKEVGIISVVDFNETCTFSSSSTLVVNISSISGDNGTAWYALTVTGTNGRDYILETGSHDVIPTNPYGLFGILITALIIIPLSTLGIKKPTLSIIFTGAGLLVAYGIGLIDMTLAALGSIIVVLIILVYKVAER